MNLKLFFVITLSIISSTALSSCTSVASKGPKEVVITDKSNSSSSNEVSISDSDFKKTAQPLSTGSKSQELPKRTLSDGSAVETLVDGFGNKSETRYFNGHARLKMLILRTSADGAKVVTVYGNGAETKVV